MIFKIRDQLSEKGTRVLKGNDFWASNPTEGANKLLASPNTYQNLGHFNFSVKVDCFVNDFSWRQVFIRKHLVHSKQFSVRRSK